MEHKHHPKPPEADYPVNQGIKPTDKAHPDRPPVDAGQPITDRDQPAGQQPGPAEVPPAGDPQPTKEPLISDDFGV